ncbi:unnamed protein product [Closterium sp. NIES-54]
MYALSVSAEGDSYMYVPPDLGIEAAALGASESALPGSAPAEALHTFTLDSGASRCFFRDWHHPHSSLCTSPGLHLPSFSTNSASTAALQDAMVTTTTPGGQRVSICTCTRTGRHLATFTRRPGSSLYALATEPPQVAASAQVSASGLVAPPCSCRLLTHQNLLWHHRLGHPSLPCLRGMHSRLLVSSLPRSLPPLPPSHAPPCLPCVEGRQCAAPHSSSFPPTTAPLETLHMDVWSPARVSGQGRERYFLLVVDDYTRYTTVFPLRSKGEVPDVLIPWICAVRLQLREWFREDLVVLRLHSDRGGEFSSNLLRDFCRGEGILYSGAGAGGTGGTTTAGPGGAGAGVVGAGGGGAGGAGAGDTGAVGAGAGGTGASDAGAGGARAGDTGAVDPGAGDDGAGGAVSGGSGAGGTVRPRPFFVPLLCQVLSLPSSTGLPPSLLSPPPRPLQSQLQPGSPLPAPSPYTEQTDSFTERREPESCPASSVRAVRTTRRIPCPRPPPVLGTHAMALGPSSVPLLVPLPPPPESSLPVVPDPASYLAPAASPTVSGLLATVVTYPSFESTAASALVAELVDFAAPCRLDYATALIAESLSASPPSVGVECALGTNVPEDWQEDFECLVAALPHLTAMDTEMASWKSTGTYVDAVPPPGANMVDSMWIFGVKRPPGSPPVFKARYVARGFSQRQGVDFFQNFSPAPKMTTHRVLLHVAAKRDYELHSLDFSTTFLQGSLHEEI